MPSTCSAASDVLALDGVGRRFRDGGGVDEVSLEVEPGEVVALLGMNGAGKTTVMRLALGMLRPQHGEVRVLGTPLAQLPRAVWTGVGTLIEVPLAYPELTVRENLRIAALLHGSDAAEVPDALETWDLVAVADRRFRRLSLGTRQRVGLAAALQHDPRLIVLDEPTAALDPASVIRLRDELTRRARAGAAILVSSHHLDEVARIADRALLLNAGRLIGELDVTGADLERAFFDRLHEDDEDRRRERSGARPGESGP